MELSAMTVGPQGWVRFQPAESDSPELYLRFRQGDDGRWRIHEVYLDSSLPVSPQALRLIPFAQCEEWANELADELARRWEHVDAVGDNMGVLASFLGTSFGGRVWLDESRDRLRTDWVATAYFSAFDPQVREESGIGYLRPPRKRQQRRGAASSRPSSADGESAYRLSEGPDTFPISDEYLRKVARAYRAAIERGDPPNVTISEDAHVDRRTAERWVAKARSRGFLGPARKGAAG